MPLCRGRRCHGDEQDLEARLHQVFPDTCLAAARFAVATASGKAGRLTSCTIIVPMKQSPAPCVLIRVTLCPASE